MSLAGRAQPYHRTVAKRTDRSNSLRAGGLEQLRSEGWVTLSDLLSVDEAAALYAGCEAAAETNPDPRDRPQAGTERIVNLTDRGLYDPTKLRKSQPF